jgi:CubicO group peptidase (beta-lactamase class C family)
MKRGPATVTAAAIALGAWCGVDGPTVEPSTAAANQDAAAPSTERGRAEQSLGKFLNRIWPKRVGGTVIAARRGEVATCRGFGKANRRTKVAARCNTVYDVMSMTKQFTAAAILKLEMMGRLRVSDPISRFVGSVPGDKRAITVHHLLTHTAGLIDSLGGDYERLSRDEMLARALSSGLRSSPGAKYRYSNVGYSILAAIVEKASGMGYEEFLAQYLFEPAGMGQTGYVLPRWNRDQVAVEYDHQGTPQGRPFGHPWANDGPFWNLRGNGGMLSTARDMLRWHVALRDERVLSEQAKRKLFTPHVAETEDGDSYYGYGWVIQRAADHGSVAWHNGGNGWSFGVLTRFLDQDVMVFWVSNQAYRKGKWNLEKLEPKLTLGVADRVLT